MVPHTPGKRLAIRCAAIIGFLVIVSALITPQMRDVMETTLTILLIIGFATLATFVVLTSRERGGYTIEYGRVFPAKAPEPPN